MVENNEDAAGRPRPTRPPAVPQKPAAAAKPAANPAARPAAAAKPGSAPSAKPIARPAQVSTSGAIKRTAPVAKPRPVDRDIDEGEEVDERPHFHKKEGLDQVTKIGLIATAGLAVIVAIVLVVVMGKHADEKKAREEYEARVEDVRQKLSTLDVSQEGDAAQAVELAEKTRETWVDHEKGRDIEMLLVKAKAKIETSKNQRETMTRFTEVEKKLADAANQTPEGIKDLRRQLDELEVKVQVLGADMLSRYQLARGGADRAYATRLLEDAKQYAADNPDDKRLALVRFHAAEDELRALVDRAYTDKNAELKAFYTPLFEQAIAESDRLVTELFSGEAGEKLPMVDCLAGAKAGEWNASQAKGFSWRIEKGVLQLIGPDADAGKNAVISIGDREQWRSFIADIEFVVEAGNVDVYFRLGKAPNANTPMYTLRTTGDSAQLRAGTAYKMRASVIGSTFTVRFADDVADPPPTHEGDLTWVYNRKGAIGLLIPPGAKLKISKFQVRELR